VVHGHCPAARIDHGDLLPAVAAIITEGDQVGRRHAIFLCWPLGLALSFGKPRFGKPNRPADQHQQPQHHSHRHRPHGIFSRGSGAKSAGADSIHSKSPKSCFKPLVYVNSAGRAAAAR
jgi:hypothetical protein